MKLSAGYNHTLTDIWHDWLSNHDVLNESPEDKKHLIKCLKKHPVDVLIVHLPILGLDGIHEIAPIRDISPNTNIVILTPCFEPTEEVSAILFGAKGYLQDDIQQSLFLKAISKVDEGEVWVDRKFVNRLLTEIERVTKSYRIEAGAIENAIRSLTPRENEIAELIALGESNRRIASKLSISERTVKAHLGVIFKKLGIHDRLKLALYINKFYQLSNLWNLTHIEK